MKFSTFGLNNGHCRARRDASGLSMVLWTTFMASTTAMMMTVVMIPTSVVADEQACNVNGCFDDPGEGPFFHRTATFLPCEQISSECDGLGSDVETGAETIDYFPGGNYLIYTDSPQNQIGFVGLSGGSNAPFAAGVEKVPGEPTTIRVLGSYAVVGVNTSPDYVNPSGTLSVFLLPSSAEGTATVVREFDLGGQPDAVDVTKTDYNGFPYYIVVAIENERDEDLGDGGLPQSPPGYVVVFTIDDEEALVDLSWKKSIISLDTNEMVQTACSYPSDPEPEYVSINDDNTQAVVSLQENNCHVIVDLASASVVNAFTAGNVTELVDIDIYDDSKIDQTDTLRDIPREPDGVAWIDDNYFAAADEGDMNGGSRGFTIYDSTTGDIAYTSGNTMEKITVRVGNYNDGRSDNKGNEPENVFVDTFENGKKYLFVLSERSNTCFVYDVTDDPTSPVFVQILQTGGVGPEGIVTIPSKNLVVIANEKDAAEDKYRSSITFFTLDDSYDIPYFPQLISKVHGGVSPIPFGALSGLAAADSRYLYTVDDSAYKPSRIMKIDTSPESGPPIVMDEAYISDDINKLSDCLGEFYAVNPPPFGLSIDEAIAKIINDDTTVNLDQEGISISTVFDGFWIVHEGRGTHDDEGRPIESPNMLLKIINHEGENHIDECITPPLGEGEWPRQLRFGFEGVAEDGQFVVVAQQRAWDGELNPRIAVYDTEKKIWKYAFYPLEDPLSPKGGWVGLGDITSLGNGKFFVVERDNQSGYDAKIKRIYEINLGDFSFEDGVELSKTWMYDLADPKWWSGGLTPEKIEGLAVTRDGKVLINNDNDAVEDNSGQNFFLHIDTLCQDNPDFEFIYTNKKGVSKKKGSCEFVAKKKKKRCRKVMPNGKKVKFDCPVTCGKC